jgi:hypothetical protein
VSRNNEPPFLHAMEVMAGLFAPSKAPMSCAIETPGETVVDDWMAKGRRVNLLS